MRIAVIGAGGVGGYFGGKLLAAGNDVTFVARGPHFHAIQEKGLKILSSSGNLHLHPVRVVESIQQVGPVDFILVAVKLWDTEGVAKALKEFADKGAAILSLQNGVDKDEVLSRFLPADSIVGALCYISSTIGEPGVIDHNGTIQRLVFGEYKGGLSPRLKILQNVCTLAGIDAEITDQIERLIWQKFVFLVGLSGTTATIRRSIGPIRENTHTRAFLLKVMREVVAVGRGVGVDLPKDYAEDRLAFCDTLPASMSSSMHHDLDKGNRLEVPWLSGGVADLGEAIGVPTPLNRAISDILALHSSGSG